MFRDCMKNTLRIILPIAVVACVNVYGASFLTEIEKNLIISSVAIEKIKKQELPSSDEFEALGKELGLPRGLLLRNKILERFIGREASRLNKWKNIRPESAEQADKLGSGIKRSNENIAGAQVLLSEINLQQELITSRIRWQQLVTSRKFGFPANKSMSRVECQQIKKAFK